MVSHPPALPATPTPMPKAMPPMADPTAFRTAGSIRGVEPTPRGCRIRTQEGILYSIEFFRENLVRLRATRNQEFETIPSWAIEAREWPELTVEIEESDPVVVRCGSHALTVTRDPVRCSLVHLPTARTIYREAQPLAVGLNGSGFLITPALGPAEHIYGLGEKAARLDRRRQCFTMWNMDECGYRRGSDPLYQSIPFAMVLDDTRAHGWFLDCSYRTRFDLGFKWEDRIEILADGGDVDLYLFAGPTPQEILEGYTALTGRPPLMPRWSLGHHQSRYSYYPADRLRWIVDQYRTRDIPLDAVHLDIHYMDDFKIFTWHPDRFPDPAGLIQDLARQGVRTVTIVDPGVKYDPGTETESHENATASTVTASHEKAATAVNHEAIVNREPGPVPPWDSRHFLHREDGSLYVGEVWPGPSVFLDYTREDASRCWGDAHRPLVEAGVAGNWMDMNEPADFRDQLGLDKGDVVWEDHGRRSTHDRMRNLFALLMARATWNGLRRIEPDRRPFLITRSGYAGIQRYSTMWTGDNRSDWESLALSIPMFLSLGLSGQPFVGADIGGFCGDSDGELLTRWYQLGFLTPLCRNHSALGTRDQEPWRFGRVYEDIIRKYLKLRYQFLPYLYTLLEESHRTGVPILRPLFLEFPSDPDSRIIDDQLMVGSALLLAPVLAPGVASRPVYFPPGLWHDLLTETTLKGGQQVEVPAPPDTVPFFVREGSVVPVGPEMNHVDELSVDPLTYQIYPDHEGNATGDLYEDDGLTLGHARGQFRRTQVTVNTHDGGTCIRLHHLKATYDPAPRHLCFVIRGTAGVRRVLMDGKPIPRDPGRIKFPGWDRRAGRVTVQITDDGHDHEFQLEGATDARSLPGTLQPGH